MGYWYNNHVRTKAFWYLRTVKNWFKGARKMWPFAHHPGRIDWSRMMFLREQVPARLLSLCFTLDIFSPTRFWLSSTISLFTHLHDRSQHSHMTSLAHHVAHSTQHTATTMTCQHLRCSDQRQCAMHCRRHHVGYARFVGDFEIAFKNYYCIMGSIWIRQRKVNRQAFQIKRQVNPWE